MSLNIRQAFSQGWHEQAERQRTFMSLGDVSVKMVGAALISVGFLLPAVEVKALDLGELPTSEDVIGALRESMLGVDPNARGNFKLEPGSPCRLIDGGTIEHINTPYAEGGHGGDALPHLDCNGNVVSDGQDLIHGFQPMAPPPEEFGI